MKPPSYIAATIPARGAATGIVPKLEHLITRFEELEFTTGIRYWNMLLETLGPNQ